MHSAQKLERVSLLCLVLACGLACSQRQSLQAVYDRAHQDFILGNLKKSQDEARAARQRCQNSEPDWAWKFRMLEAESLLSRGMFNEVLELTTVPAAPADHGLAAKMFSINAVAFSRLHKFHEAEIELAKGEQICVITQVSTCGDVIRARGVFAIQRGDVEAAKESFEQLLKFSRAQQDQVLESTALLNLGLVSLQQEHFDESADWTNDAYRISSKSGAAQISQIALGNLGWAYYKLGDFERSLELSVEAERLADQSDDVIRRLYWTTNVGYVHAQRQDLQGARISFSKALSLAEQINSTEGIYNALRALALVSVEAGELDEAKKYSDRAIALARSDKNRLDELYPLLVQGMIAARSNQPADAERIFREVENDPVVNASLKWQAEHELARLYENDGKVRAASREYRTALATFESARDTVHREDSQLSFLTNASRIYDDYIHFLVTHNQADEALRWADFSRARTLSEGLGLLKKGEHEPPQMNARQLARQSHGTALFYWLGEKQSYLWAITPQKVDLFRLPARAQIEEAVSRYRKNLTGPQIDLAPGGQSPDHDGTWLFQTLVEPAQVDLQRVFASDPSLRQNPRIFIVPDGALNNLNFETLVAPAPQPHYWIEDVSIVNVSSLRMISSSLTRKSNRVHSLLLIGDTVSPSPEYPELPHAADQMAAVASRFSPTQEKVFSRAQATTSAYEGSHPEQFSYIHFVAHGTASRLSPLDSAIILSKAGGEADDPESFKLYARNIKAHPIHAELVTISACYSAGERFYAGEGLVGLAWAFLHAGAHNVVAASWEATDASTQQLMDSFYGDLNGGAAPDIALRNAKLSLLHSAGAFHKPFYWAPFQLFAGSPSQPATP